MSISINAKLDDIRSGVNMIEHERDDAIQFLRSCLEKDLTVIHDNIRDYLDDYDCPF